MNEPAALPWFVDLWKINVSGNAASLASQLIAEPRTKTAAAVRNDAPLLD
jgi:hypothetical protein